MSDEQRSASGLTRAQLVVFIIGAVYFLLGIVGFWFLGDAATALTGSDDDDRMMLGLELSALQNVVHLVIGITATAAATGERRSRTFGVGLAVVGAALFVLGVIAALVPATDFLGLNWASNILHGITALVGVGVAVMPRKPADAAQSAA